MTRVRTKSYIDAINAERVRVAMWQVTAIVGTLGGMIFGIFRATGVLAQTFEKRMDTTNEWRGALEDQAKDKATVQQFDQLKELVMEVREDLAAIKNKNSGSGGLWKTFAAVLAGAAAAVVIATFLGRLT